MFARHLVNRFDIFEHRHVGGTRLVVWHGTYQNIEEAEKLLRKFAAESQNEFYVKDLQLGLIVARANTPEVEAPRY